MLIEKIQNVTLVYEPAEQHDADVVKEAITRCSQVCLEVWGLKTPMDAWVVVMTDWEMFLDVAMPANWQFQKWFIKRFQGSRFEQIWQVAGGWNQSFGKRVATGVKPGRLIEKADRRIGKKIFVKETEMDQKVFSVTCHELTHAFSDYLKLPAWLHEGLAMRTADLCMDKQTVLPETLNLLKDSMKGRITRYDLQDENTLVLLYVRSYWLTRLLEAEKMETLKRWLQRPMRPTELEKQLASVIDLPLTDLWGRMDAFLWEYFEKRISH